MTGIRSPPKWKSQRMSFKPLTGFTVLDLTSVVVGPVCTARLGHYGADIIKLESPEGDLMRGLGGQSPTGQHSGTYLHLNRCKRNICCDLKKPEAGAILKRLVEKADIIIANMRPKALERLGLDHETILAAYPQKIYCLITGYGSDGPYAGYPTYDSVVQAASGIPGLIAMRDGTPAYAPLVMCDHIVGEMAAGAVLAAVTEKLVSGKGTFVEVPMFETMATFVLQEHLAQHSFVPAVGPAGDQRLLSPHNRPVQTKDGWIAFTVNTDKQVQAYLDATGKSDVKSDPRFASVAARADNVMAWFAIRGAPLLERTTSEWLGIFRAADIAAMPCHDIESLRQDEHLNAVGIFGTEEHPAEGETITLRSPLRFNGSAETAKGFPQPKGWDSAAIAHDMGFSDEEVAALITSGAIIENKSPNTPVKQVVT
jgi:crotonobetainyl-CoA:carnitine CoA-transferase CaiB-like acyl-CoA transferase